MKISYGDFFIYKHLRNNENIYVLRGEFRAEFLATAAVIAAAIITAATAATVIISHTATAVATTAKN